MRSLILEKECQEMAQWRWERLAVLREDCFVIGDILSGPCADPGGERLVMSQRAGPTKLSPEKGCILEGLSTKRRQTDLGGV